MAQTKIKLIADGVIDENHLKVGHTITTDNIGEGTNLYYTDARVGSYLSTNSYATEGYVTTAVANLVDTAPSTLDTLNELAAALGDDPNFATTVTNSIATKLPLAGGTLTGDLGIGTTPNQPLHVLTSTGFSTRFESSTSDSLVLFSNSVATYSPRIGSLSSDFAIYTGSAERMRINSSGDIGIGTDTPSQNWTDGAKKILHLKAGSGASAIITVGDGDGTNGNLQLVGASNGDAGIYNFANGNMRFGTDSVERMRIDSSGNVGIGTTSPNGKAHIRNSALSGFVARTGATLTLENNGATELYISSANNSNGQLRFGDTDSNFRGAISYEHSSDAFLHYTAGTERMRIDSSGRVLVNTTTDPSITNNGGVSIAPANNNRAIMRLATTGSGYLNLLDFYNSNGLVGAISTNGTSISLGFGGTAAANQLDDYEEGTWTPTFSGEGNVTSLAKQGNALYTKIGRVVHLAMEISGAFTSSTDESRFQFTLPFTAYSTTFDNVGTAGFFIGGGANRFGIGSVWLGTTSNAVTSVYIPAREVQQPGNWGQMRISLTYFTS